MRILAFWGSGAVGPKQALSRLARRCAAVQSRGAGLSTAMGPGLTIPQKLLARVDEVFE
jgi:hypothetical protein